MSTTTEHFVFTSGLRNKLLLAFLAGSVLVGLGLWLSDTNAHHATAHHGSGGGSGGAFIRLIANLWVDNVFFIGLSAVGVLFVAIHYVSRAGWSVLVKRVPEALGYWLPFGGILMLGIFWIGQHDLFHWTHEILYEPTLADGSTNTAYDEVLDGKKGFLNVPFYLIRMVACIGIWYVLFRAIRKASAEEDLQGGSVYWHKSFRLSAIFIVFFGISSSVVAWDWVMSIDAHWFSTLFAWYLFSSWWVAMLALTTFIIILLKDAGYLKQINENHFDDLGKYIFAFSIFWAYLWFSQFLLIYYANIPEESTYFVTRVGDVYKPMFVINLVINFALPFVMLMTRDSKRYRRFLALVCPIVVLGHWLDFVLMVTPGVLKDAGGSIGLIEIGCFVCFLSLFLLISLKGLTRVGLFGKNDPFLEESLHHHV